MKTKIEELLARFGKKIGIDLLYLFKNGSWVTLRFVVFSVGGLLLSLSFTRIGTKELLGQYQYVIALLSILSIFSLPGLNTAALESVTQGHEGAIIRAVKISFLSSLLGAVVLFGFGLFMMISNKAWLLGITLIFSGLLFPLYSALNTWNVYYDGKSAFAESAWRYIVLNILLTGSLILGLFLRVGLFGLVILFLLVNLVCFSLFFNGVVKKIRDRKDNVIDLKFGILVSIQRFVLGLSSTLPVFVISHMFGVESVAIYYIATYFIGALFAFFGTIFYLYIPALFRKDKLYHRNILLQNVVIGIFGWVAFIIFLKLFFRLLYGEGYDQSLSLAYSISLLLLFIPLKTYLFSFFMTRKRNWLLIIAVCFANAVSFVLFYSVRDWGFSSGVVVYLYAIELLTTLPLLFVYVRGVTFRNSAVIAIPG